MYFGSSNTPAQGLAAAQPKKKTYGLAALPTFGFSDSFAAPPAPARTTPVQMAQPPAPSYKPVAPPPTLNVPSGHPGGSLRISTQPGTGGSQGLANQGYGAPPGAGNYGGAPTTAAAKPQGLTPPNFTPAPPAGLGVDPRMERMLAAYEAQVNKNMGLRDDGIARLAGMANPYADPNGQQALGLAGARRALDSQGTRDSIHGRNDAINRMMAGGGLLAQQDLNALSDNVRAGVMNQQAGLAADYANRATEWDRWRENLRGQFEQADLAGSQISNLVTQSRQGATLGAELDQMRAQTTSMVAQGRLTASQAQQAEDIAKNQGWFAAMEFLIKASESALKITGIL